MSEVRALFGTALIAEKLADTGILSELGRSARDERERDPEGLGGSATGGGWQSNKRMLVWGGDPARKLGQHVAILAGQHTRMKDGSPVEGLAWRTEMFANVSRRGDANNFHVHAGAFWSAVVYIDDGYEGDNDPALGGRLQLLDPRMPMVAMAAPHLRYAGPDGTAQDSLVAIRPQTGLVVLFPGWLQHAVQTFHGAGTRIAASINLVAPTR